MRCDNGGVALPRTGRDGQPLVTTDMAACPYGSIEPQILLWTAMFHDRGASDHGILLS